MGKIRTRKSMSALAATALLLTVPVLGSQAAQAAQAGPGLSEGTYTVTANVYADKSDTPLGQNAYVTNPGNPPLNPPTSPVTDNATLTVDQEGKVLLTVPFVNTTLGALEIAAASTDGTVTVKSKTSVSWSTWKGTQQRISSVTFDVTSFDGSYVATFSPCEEYVNFVLYLGEKSWDLHLVVDFASAQPV